MGDVLWYIVNSAAWSGFGFWVGWITARLARDVHQMSQKGGDDD